MVNQTGARAQGDLVGGNKTQITFLAPGPALGVVGQLLLKLQHEVESNAQVRDTVEALARFHVRRAADGVVGLEAKLAAGKREAELFDALERKEQFAKLLDTWSLYASAQEIFAFLLARIEYEFNTFILPQINHLTQIELNEIVDQKIVEPTVAACGASIFVLDHGTVMGMIYWLAEQCYVRWHQ